MSITVYIPEIEGAERNFANANFFAVTAALGLSSLMGDYCGALSGENLRYAIATIEQKTAAARRATMRDGGWFNRPYVDAAPGRATMISCGQDSEYLAEAIDDLLRLMELAKDNDTELVWC